MFNGLYEIMMVHAPHSNNFIADTLNSLPQLSVLNMRQNIITTKLIILGPGSPKEKNSFRGLLEENW